MESNNQIGCSYKKKYKQYKKKTKKLNKKIKSKKLQRGTSTENMTINGVVAMYKPRDMTSNDVVNFVSQSIKKYYRQNNIQEKAKVGHGGTLDKDAEGVLVLGIGKGTKMMQDFLKGDKVYQATGILGKETDTLDHTGELIKECEFKHISQKDLEESLKKFIGEIEQIPPLYSALKHKGERISDIVRRGEEIKLEPRKVHIYNLKLTSLDLPKFIFDANVGGGTYIRSLIRDIGTELKSCAYMFHLLRKKQGVFTLDDTVKLDDNIITDIKNKIKN
jgi:tRNA pseudouridine55 synthase